MAINEQIRLQFDLRKVDERLAEMADGFTKKRDLYEHKDT